jgi:hypothetical protein
MPEPIFPKNKKEINTNKISKKKLKINQHLNTYKKWMMN